MPVLLTASSGRIKAARKLADRRFRKQTGRFLIEGPQVLTEALGGVNAVREVFATPEAAERYASLRERCPIEWELADSQALASLSDTVTPTGLVASCAADSVIAPLRQAISEDASLVVVCADIRDPGNAGTIVRCADAVGADAVIFAGHCVDPLNSKSVRASVGSLFHLPICVGEDVAEAFGVLRQRRFTLLGTDGAAADSLFEIDDTLQHPVAWVFGNEAWGLPAAIAAGTDRQIGIPILGQAESLNLATAAAVCLYATVRARHQPAAGRAGAGGQHPGT